MTPVPSPAAVQPQLLRPARPGTAYRLSDLQQRHRRGDTVFLTDAALQHDGPDDPLLYVAHRNVLAPRSVGGAGWSADLVVYQPGALPGGELIRSTGHWNTPRQLEIFQTLTGTVLMLCAWHAGTGEPELTYQLCPAGTLAVIPFGGWHLTLVLDGPAAVFNFYADLPGPCSVPTPAVAVGGLGPATDHNGKYRRAAPVELTAIRDGTGFKIIGPTGASRWGAALQVWEPAWLRDIVGGDLPGFFQNADHASISVLVDHARRLVPTHRSDPR